MGKKSTKPKAGTKLRVKAGVASPDFPDILFEGWQCKIVEVSKKKAGTKYIVEWDEETLGKMPDDYVKRCEEQQLFYQMAYLDPEEVEVIED